MPEFIALLTEQLFTTEALVALLTITALEIVLGIDNLVFIAILSQRLPEHQRPKAWRIGLMAAAGVRVILLLTVGWVMRLDSEFSLLGWHTSPKDLILIAGGFFLLWKATHEIHAMLTPHAVHTDGKGAAAVTLGGVIVQILLLDMVFSLDSVITAVGMTDIVPVMILAVLIAIGVMLTFAKPLSDFVRRHPPIKMLALAFLVLIGGVLLADGFGHHIPRGYIYSAMGFAVLVELLQLNIDPTHKPKKGKIGAPPVELPSANGPKP
ncbi:MAG: TerC family protein [Planctomycetota bacterium]